MTTTRRVRLVSRDLVLAAMAVSAVAAGLACGDGKESVREMTWSATGSMALARRYQNLTPLPSGKVLATGFDDESPSTAPEVYDEVAGTWKVTGSMAAPRGFHTATRLLTGKVLVTGGWDGRVPPGVAFASAELFDEGVGGGTWATTGSMSEPRLFSTASLLRSGKVLVAGGQSAAGTNAMSTAEIFDPGSGTFSPTGSMAQKRWWHTATVLPSGKVLVVGGCTDGERCQNTTGSAELYDPGTGMWSSAGTMSHAVNVPAATLLPNGKVLVTGGCPNDGACSPADNLASLYDPGTNQWVPAASMHCARFGHATRILTSGKVLVAAGTMHAGAGCQKTTEVYDPSTDQWSWGPPMVVDHGSGVQSAPLPSGAWLVAGGVLHDSGTFTTIKDAEFLRE